MCAFRIKEVKGSRPVASKGRLPTNSDAVGGRIYAWERGTHKWGFHTLEEVKAHPFNFPFWRSMVS